MSVTPNYGWPLIATNQSSPEVTHNAAMVDIDAALGSILQVILPDSDYTLNLAAVPSEASYLVYHFVTNPSIGLSADRSVIVPVNKKLYVVWNNTTAPHNITVKTASGSGIVIPYSATASYVMVYCDGTNVVLVGIAGATGATGAYVRPTVNLQTAANYNAMLSDDGNVVTMDYATACTFTVPSSGTVAFSIGATITFIQKGAGQVTVSFNASLVTVNTPSSFTTRSHWSTVSLIQIATDVWVAAGDLT